MIARFAHRAKTSLRHLSFFIRPGLAGVAGDRRRRIATPGRPIARLGPGAATSPAGRYPPQGVIESATVRVPTPGSGVFVRTIVLFSKSERTRTIEMNRIFGIRRAIGHMHARICGPNRRGRRPRHPYAAGAAGEIRAIRWWCCRWPGSVQVLLEDLLGTNYVRDQYELQLTFVVPGDGGGVVVPRALISPWRCRTGTSRSPGVTLDGVPVRVMTLEMLIATKGSPRPDEVGGAKDRADLAALRSVATALAVMPRHVGRDRATTRSDAVDG